MGSVRTEKEANQGYGERGGVTPSFPWDKKKMITLPKSIPHIRRVYLTVPKQSLGKVQIKKGSPLLIWPMYVFAVSKDTEAIRSALEWLVLKIQDKSPSSVLDPPKSHYKNKRSSSGLIPHTKFLGVKLGEIQCTFLEKFIFSGFPVQLKAPVIWEVSMAAEASSLACLEES